MPEVNVPRIGFDPFTYEALPRHHELMREALSQAPVCYLEPYGVYVTGEHRHAQTMFKEWQTFTSTVKAFGEREFIRKTLVQEDPPDHAHIRNPMMRLFTPVSLKAYEDYFTQQAEILADAIVERGTVDGASDIAAPFVLKVFPDIIGAIDLDRPKLLPWADLSFNSNVPSSQVYLDSKARYGDILQWFNAQIRRDNFSAEGMAGQVYAMADEGIISHEEADVMIVIIFSAGFDTTISAIGSGLKLLAENPAEWQKLRDNPALVRTAFEETIRMEPPARAVGRGVKIDNDLWGVQLKAGDKVASFLAVVGRDASVWENPDEFHVDRRKVMGHLAFGGGIHACSGQALARMEYNAIITALVKRVKTIELAGEPKRKVNNNASGYDEVPLRLVAG